MENYCATKDNEDILAFPDELDSPAYVDSFFLPGGILDDSEGTETHAEEEAPFTPILDPSHRLLCISSQHSGCHDAHPQILEESGVKCRLSNVPLLHIHPISQNPWDESEALSTQQDPTYNNNHMLHSSDQPSASQEVNEWMAPSPSLELPQLHRNSNSLSFRPVGDDNNEVSLSVQPLLLFPSSQPSSRTIVSPPGFQESTEQQPLSLGQQKSYLLDVHHVSLGADTADPVVDPNANLDDESKQLRSLRSNGSLSKQNVYINKFKTSIQVDNMSIQSDENENLTGSLFSTTLESISLAPFKRIDDEQVEKCIKSRKQSITKTNTREILESSHHLYECSANDSSPSARDSSETMPKPTEITNSSTVKVSNSQQSTSHCQSLNNTTEMAKSKLKSLSISKNQRNKDKTNLPVCVKSKNALVDLGKDKVNQTIQREAQAQDPRLSSSVNLWPKFCLLQTPSFLHSLFNSLSNFFREQLVLESYCFGRLVVSALAAFIKIVAVVALATGNIVKYAIEESLLQKFLPLFSPTDSQLSSSGMTPICYLVMYCTPILCDWIMDHLDLPHFAPHIISNGILFTLCLLLERQFSSDKADNIVHSIRGKTENSASGKKQRQLQTRQLSVEQRKRLANDLSYSILRTIRWEAIPFAFIVEGFSEKNSTIMLFDSSTRLIIAFLLSSMQGDNLLSPLFWMGWAIQVLFSAYLPHGISLDIILLLTGMAFIRLVTTLSCEM
jgi:hypothetical protein